MVGTMAIAMDVDKHMGLMRPIFMCLMTLEQGARYVTRRHV